MPATAGRVRMPANNRVHSSAALQTHGIWQSAIGYDPYAPATAKESGSGVRPGSDSSAYASFQGLLALARITGSNSNETRGACRKCGRVGHLTYQCRNFLILKEVEEKDGEGGDRTALRTADEIMEKIKKSSGTGNGVREESSEEEEVESSSSDSGVDPEIERIIKKRYGWTLSKNVSLEDEEEERRERRRRRHKRKDQRRERDSESSDDSSEDSKRSDRHRRKRRRKREVDSLSASDSSYGDRKERNRGEKRSHHRRRHCKD